MFPLATVIHRYLEKDDSDWYKNVYDKKYNSNKR